MPATGKRRALGQHFLKDRTLAEKIAEESLAMPVHYSLPQKEILNIANKIRQFWQF